jgi:glycosyltransferase involved in cell wall biosynthesis
MIEKHFIVFLKISLTLFFFKRKKVKSDSLTKITIINTFDHSGGAAKVALTIAKELVKEIDLVLFVKEKRTNEIWVEEITPTVYGTTFELLRRTANKYGWIEFTGFNSLNLLNKKSFVASKFVHIHNIHGEFLSPAIFTSLFKGKNVIWTLHDESFITGHCSCTLGCDRWQNGCGNCPDLSIYPSVKYDNTKNVLKFKKKQITKLQPIVVTPSRWLAERVQDSYPNLNQIKVIPNGVDEDVFYPRNKIEARKILKLPLNKKLILFVAEFSTKNPFKGGHIFRELISDFDFIEYNFVTVGGEIENYYSNHIAYPYIDKEDELALLYAASDVLLYPTQADNLPLVVLESMACGTPVIASKLGGIPEIIIDNSNGFLVCNYRKVSEFKKSLTLFLSLSETEMQRYSMNARETIVSNFTQDKMISEYRKIYQI